MRKLAFLLLMLGALIAPISTAIGCSCTPAAAPKQDCCHTPGEPCACCPESAPGSQLGDPGCNGEPLTLATATAPAPAIEFAPASCCAGMPAAIAPLLQARRARRSEVRPSNPSRPLYLLACALRR